MAKGYSTNLLKNGNLEGVGSTISFQENSGNFGTVEHPKDWSYEYTSQHEGDPFRIPQSLHTDDGFKIAAGWRKWVAGYAQPGLSLKAGQRYLAKAVLTPDITVTIGGAEVPSTVEWRFVIDTDTHTVSSVWNHSAWGTRSETLFVFEVSQDCVATFHFEARSQWEDNTCNLNIHELSLEEVAADYGDVIGAWAKKRPAEIPEAVITDDPSTGEVTAIEGENVFMDIIKDLPDLISDDNALRSKRYKAALTVIIGIIISVWFPEFEGYKSEMIVAFAALGLALIGGYSTEDALRAYKA